MFACYIPDLRDGLNRCQRAILQSLIIQEHLQATDCNSKVIIDRALSIFSQTDSHDYYRCLAGLAQNWKARYPLVGHWGHFGSIAGHPPPAPELNTPFLSDFGEAVLQDALLDVSVSNHPVGPLMGLTDTPLRTRLPMLMIEGCCEVLGSSRVAMPPHNLVDVTNTIRALLKEPEMSSDDLATVLGGPDFPTGGIVSVDESLKEYYRTGQGTIVHRARMHIEVQDCWPVVVITQIPFGYVRNQVLETLMELVVRHWDRSSTFLRDMSDVREPVRIEIHFRNMEIHAVRDLIQPEIASTLEQHLELNAHTLIAGEPHLASLRDGLIAFLRHRDAAIRGTEALNLLSLADPRWIHQLAASSIDQIQRELQELTDDFGDARRTSLIDTSLG